MTNLITLNYEQNNLANINSIPVLPNLESLDLRDCKLSTIPRMTGLKRLKKINLSYNDGLVLPTEGMSLPAI
jgi:Leucine-rich repeat (LRR) protein